MVTGAGNSGAGGISGLIAITATEQSEDHSDDEEQGNDDTHGLCQFVVVFLFLRGVRGENTFWNSAGKKEVRKR